MSDSAGTASESLPEPWQDMHGSGRDRSGARWLSLDDDRQTMRQDVVRLGRRALDTAKVASPQFDRIIHPCVGDIVVENATMYRVTRDGFDPLASDWYRGAGFLIAVRSEWIHTDEEWAALLAEPDPFGYSPEDKRPAERRAWYVQYGPAPVDVCRWTNAGFYAVPTEWAAR